MLPLGNRLLIVKQRKDTHSYVIMVLTLQLGKFMKIPEESSMTRLSSIKITYHSSVKALKGEGDAACEIFP